jgi:hypothetical protein
MLIRIVDISGQRRGDEELPVRKNNGGQSKRSALPGGAIAGVQKPSRNASVAHF